MRVVLLSTSYPNHPGDPSGHFVEAEAEDLAEQGHDVHVIVPGRSFGRERGKDPTVWRALGRSLFGMPGALPRLRERPWRIVHLGPYCFAVRGLLHRLAPVDRTIAHFIVPSGYPLALATAGDLEIVAHGSDVALLCAMPKPFFQHVIDALLHRKARFRFAAESGLEAVLRKLCLRDQRAFSAACRVEPPALKIRRVDDAERARRRKTLGRGDNPQWVVCARLVASKRIDRAIRLAKRHGADLTIIGDGPMRETLARLGASLGMNPNFVGQLPRDECLGLIASADKLVHLSDREGAPSVVREARALGVPVLATPVGDVARWARLDPGIEILPNGSTGGRGENDAPTTRSRPSPVDPSGR